MSRTVVSLTVWDNNILITDHGLKHIASGPIWSTFRLYLDTIHGDWRCTKWHVKEMHDYKDLNKTIIRLESADKCF